MIKDPKATERMGENLYEITEELFDVNKVAYHRLDILEFAMQKTKEKKEHEKKNEDVQA